MNAHIAMLLSPVYSGALSPLHRADLGQSHLTHDTIQRQKIRSVPPGMIEPLLGFNPPGVTSAYLIPFADPAGGWMDHVRMKIFPTLQSTKKGGKAEQKTSTVKYLQPKKTGSRLYFPLATMRAVLESQDTLWICEGEKKALLVAQRDQVPVVGICGVEGWHAGGESELLEDFDHILLKGRIVKVAPDGDVEDNVNVSRAVWRLGAALEARGALPELVHLPQDLGAAA